MLAVQSQLIEVTKSRSLVIALVSRGSGTHTTWLDRHGGTINSISEGENGGMILHIVCDFVQMVELDVP